MDEQTQIPVTCTAARDRLVLVIAANEAMAESAKRVLDVIKAHPETDVDFAKVFSIPMPLKT